jgi:hypothetical protein
MLFVLGGLLLIGVEQLLDFTPQQSQILGSK